MVDINLRPLRLAWRGKEEQKKKKKKKKQDQNIMSASATQGSHNEAVSTK